MWPWARGRRPWKPFQIQGERTNRSFAEHVEWQHNHRVPPTFQVLREFLTLRREAGPQTFSEDAPDRRAGPEIQAEELGSGLPSGSGREERGGEPPRDATTDKREVRGDIGFPTDERHSETSRSENVEMDFVGTHAPHADIGILEPDSDDEESTQLLARIGCSAERAPTCRRRRRRSAISASKEVIVSEIYSPQRIM